MDLQSIRQLDYEAKVSHPQYRHLEAHGKGKKKYYYTMAGGHDEKGLTHVFVTMKTGSTYEGTVNSNNERHGWGVYQVIFGGRYEGEWRNGFKHGQGTSYYKNNKIQYEGEWEGGEPHGFGKVYNTNGKLLYEGPWKGGLSPHGIYMERYKTKV